MATKIPKNTKNTQKPYKRAIFDAYVTWKSIPASMRQNGANRMRDFIDGDDQFAELLTIETQTEFANKYEIENSTLTNWNYLIAKKDELSTIRKWGKRLTKNLLLSLYTNALRTGSSESTKLWFQIVEGWDNEKEKNTNRNNYKPVEVIYIKTRTAK